MYPIGQNILTTNPHFETAILQPPQFLILYRRFVSRQTRLFLITSFPFYGTSFRRPTGKCISYRNGNIYFITTWWYPYCNGYFLNLNSTCRFKIYRKYSYSDDNVRVVIFLIRVSRVFLILSTSNKEFRHSTPPVSQKKYTERHALSKVQYYGFLIIF